METFLIIVDSILKIGFWLLYTVLFCISVNKCFRREEKGKAGLYIITFLCSPVLTFFLSLMIQDMVGNIFWPESVSNTGQVLDGHIVRTVFFCAELVFIYLMLILAGIWVMGKKLRLENTRPLLFLSLMFNTISLMSLKGTDNDMFSVPDMGIVIDLVECLLLILAAILLYYLDVRALSVITKKKIKAEVNWRVFTVPPTVFIAFFSTLTILLTYYSSMRDEIIVLFVYIFSTIIIFLFIWAFYVIIRNISATNEAVEAKDEVKELSVEVMEALAHTIDAKDEYTRGHSVRVAKYSRMIAEKVGMSAEECDNVYYMGLLHDLGKIGVPNEIINSPSKLTDEEYAVVKTHPGLGFDILSEIKSRPDLVLGARWHHERYDGRGYPDGKKGEDIPLMARIIAVADSYDAMTSNRSYRKYMPQGVVRAEIEKNKGSQFDPDIADCMIHIIDGDTDYRLHE